MLFSQQPSEMGTIIVPILQMGKWGPEGLENCPKVLLLVSGGTWICLTAEHSVLTTVKSVSVQRILACLTWRQNIEHNDSVLPHAEEPTCLPQAGDTALGFGGSHVLHLWSDLQALYK